MPQYALAYYGVPQFESEVESKKEFEKYQAWLGGLGDAVVNPGMPLGAPRKVSSNGVTDVDGPDRLTGFTIVEAENIEAAIEMTKSCPYLEHDCTIDVAEVFQM
jgi:hypothetical protein